MATHKRKAPGLQARRKRTGAKRGAALGEATMQSEFLLVTFKDNRAVKVTAHPPDVVPTRSGQNCA